MKEEFFKEYVNLLESMKFIDFGDDLTEEDFIKSIILLNPQTYGNRIERRIICEMKGKKVKPSLNKGDMEKNGEFYEIKTSILFNKNNSLNLVQLRLWQNVDYYLCIGYDLRNFKYKKYSFLLTKEEMIKETKLCKMSSAHGTKKINKKNSNVELRFSLKFSNKNEHFKRWLKNYKYNG
jgi:hypothetical protein